MIITDEIIQGNPLQIEKELKIEITNQILKMGNDYENVCNNMRITADVFELLEENINKDFIKLKFNPMGAWYVEEGDDYE